MLQDSKAEKKGVHVKYMKTAYMHGMAWHGMAWHTACIHAYIQTDKQTVCVYVYSL